MNDEDLLRLVTSIDENDIEIIGSNSSETGDQLEFIPDHFAIRTGTTIPVAMPSEPPTPPSVPVKVDREDPEVSSDITRVPFHDPSSSSVKEFEDETFVERLYGLTEMFPDWFISLSRRSFHYSQHAGHWMRRALWFCSSSLLVLVVPILVQLEVSQVAEMQADQTRQVTSARLGEEKTRTNCTLSLCHRLDPARTIRSNRIEFNAVDVWYWTSIKSCVITIVCPRSLFHFSVLYSDPHE